jgi:ATP-dependent DNA helicase RecG
MLGRAKKVMGNLHPRWPLHRALTFLHQPTPDVALATLEDRSHPAWQRLKAEELLAQQLSQLQSKRERARLRAPALTVQRDAANLSLHEQLMAALPFALTGAQRRVGEEIAKDLARPVPMHRLLQGDVGSGKTVVAALAAAIAMDAGWQCALMAPTEILAEQHFRKLIGWLEPVLAPRGQCVAWLTGSQKKKERTAMLALIASGEAALVVGTHAVIQEQVQFKNLALAIIDEQHRFGVAQRLALRSKMVAEGQEPHLLMMSATPIPRTLAMSYYADLDVSTLDELPPGRTPIVTKVVSDHRRDEVIDRIRAQLAAGRQVYWVCPLIEESEALDLTNATETHAQLTEALQAGAAHGEPPVMVGLLHSRMPVAEKKAVMSLFTGGQMGLLVSTTVIEVGVDVPNASLMVIEHAERFGLSQLHQLRGRVGRGAAASACVLLYSTGDAPRLGETARARLKAMAETNDGFEIARRDLDIRGPGEFLGARQSMTLTELKYIVAVARERHFGKAADACYVSQPTLSVAVKKLEEELDVKLFERSANEVTVTPAGRRNRAPGAKRAGAGGQHQGDCQTRQRPAGRAAHAGHHLHHRPVSAARPGAPDHRAHAADAADAAGKLHGQAAGDAAHRRDGLRHSGRAVSRCRAGRGAPVRRTLYGGRAAPAIRWPPQKA